jgi:CRP-like cAMP-binding protein
MKNPQKSFAAPPAVLQSAVLFKGIEGAALGPMLACIGAETVTVGKGGIILLVGDKPRHVGITLTGVVHVVREDHDGNRSLLAAIAPGEMFAEALCCAGIAESPVTVTAASDATVMLLPYTRILQICPDSCPFHTKLIENMLRLVAGNNLLLQSRMELLSLKSIRARVLRYLESFVPQQGGHITIPFNREELADFLCVERSALSHALARMKKDGLIEYRKNTFIMQWRK